jgi:hypothetical protein
MVNGISVAQSTFSFSYFDDITCNIVGIYFYKKHGDRLFVLRQAIHDRMSG